MASNFVIHPQILTFTVFKIASLSSLRTKSCSQSLFCSVLLCFMLAPVMAMY